EDLHSNTVVDLLEKSADDFNHVETSRIGTIDRYVRQQGDNHFNVLASDEDPERQDMVDGDGFRTVHQILERFNRMIFVDTGNNARAEHFLAAMEATDQLVIPVSAGLDSALVAEKMMKALTARGYGDLVQNAVVMLHDSESRKIDDTDTARRFEGKVGAVIPIPFDAALKDGGKIDYDALQPATRRAYQEAAAAIAQNLRNQIKETQA
ncbi:MAG: chromosome partitioning protein, partial [Kocuria sp.]|nr:chromosome partitioning protein [Kocuria sp.]